MNNAAAVMVLLLAGSFGLTAQAAQVELDTGDVHISFDDQSSYMAEVYSNYSGLLYSSYTVPPWSTYGNTIEFSPGLYGDLGGSGYADSGYLRFELGGFTITPQAGHVIDGFRVSFYGEVDSVGAGSYSIYGTNGSFWQNGTSYSYHSDNLSNVNDWFLGRIDLDAPYVEGPDGTAIVYGTARGSIDRITIEAFTRPVPEPETWAMLGSGAVLLAAVRRRAQRRR